MFDKIVVFQVFAILLAFSGKSLGEYGKVEVIKVSSNFMNLQWSKPNTTSQIDHYYYEIKPMEGPISIPDLMKKSFCHNETCIEQTDYLRSCVNYSIHLQAVIKDSSNITYETIFNATEESTPSAAQSLTQVSSEAGIVSLKWMPPNKYTECANTYKVCYVQLPETQSSPFLCHNTPPTNPENWYNEVTHDVHGLETCGNYRFSIRPVTFSGTEGPEIVINGSATFEDPSELQELVINSITDSEAKLVWKGPIKNSKCVDSYEVISNQCNQVQTTTTTTTIEPVSTESSLTTTTDYASPISSSSTTELLTTFSPYSNDFKIMPFITAVGSNEHELTIGKLFPCTCYDFYVRALKKDRSVLSESKHVIGNTLSKNLTAPIDLELQNLNNTNATISWKVSQDALNCVESYKVTWTVGNVTTSEKVLDKMVFSKEIGNLLPCQTVNVTVESMKLGVGTKSQEFLFNTTDAAPGIAKDVQIYNLDSDGFHCTWHDPDLNPQCGKVWTHSITIIDESSANTFNKCNVTSANVEPYNNHVFRTDNLHTFGLYLVNITGFSSSESKEQSVTFNCVVKL